MKVSQRLAVLLVLWLPFSVAALAAIAITFGAIAVGDKEQQQGYGKNVLRAMDKVLAAVAGYSGAYTFSAEIGMADANRNRFGFTYAWVRKALDSIQPGHCEGSAKNEQLMQDFINNQK